MASPAVRDLRCSGLVSAGAIFRKPVAHRGLLFLIAAYAFWPRKKDEGELPEDADSPAADSGIDPPLQESLDPQPVAAVSGGESDAGIEILPHPEK